ncbi:hypothetical protein HELRODRAFT_164272 [Helobdella robusta]|uniref:HTH psq-type domain-containing protein n=1 Tax=Helobdella robusta TaxID=6412 RepID=T1EV69_HELRO|nr:hypothetical protein HELRODRAFT_164272 [Helobdella robusta]ESN94431.1 hypothetical protein HELRODRAFT_164272 [Helobdella robusta]
MESTLQKKFLNLEEKMLVVKKLNDGVSIRKIAEEFGCGNTDVQLIEADSTITSPLSSVTWENFVTMDNNDDSIHSPQSFENHEQFEVQDDEEEEEAPVQEVSTKMALQCARKLTSYSIHMGNRELLQFSENIENILEIELLKTKCFGKQTTMNDFLP